MSLDEGFEEKYLTFAQLTLSVSGLWFEDTTSQLSASVTLAFMSSMMDSYPLELGTKMSSSSSCLWSWCLITATEKKLMWERHSAQLPACPGSLEPHSCHCHPVLTQTLASSRNLSGLQHQIATAEPPGFFIDRTTGSQPLQRDTVGLLASMM